MSKTRRDDETISDGDSDNDNKETWKRIYIPVETFEAPAYVEQKSFHAPPERQSNGSGIEREILRHVQDISREHSKLSPSAKAALAKEGMYDNKENDCNDSSETGSSSDDSNGAELAETKHYSRGSYAERSEATHRI